MDAKRFPSDPKQAKAFEYKWPEESKQLYIIPIWSMKAREAQAPPKLAFLSRRSQWAFQERKWFALSFEVDDEKEVEAISQGRDLHTIELQLQEPLSQMAKELLALLPQAPQATVTPRASPAQPQPQPAAMPAQLTATPQAGFSDLLC